MKESRSTVFVLSDDKRLLQERAIQTGRIVPRQLLEDTLEEVPKSVERLVRLVDYHIELHNAPHAPDIIPVTPHESWDSFMSQWIQYVSRIDSAQTKIANCQFQPTELARGCRKAPSNLKRSQVTLNNV